MSNEEFENYVALMGKLLQFSPEQREQISGELQDHLQMRVADLMSEGVARSEAISMALEEFGDAAVMAKNFQSVINLKRRRWMMRFATYSIVCAFLMAILTMAMWPENSRFGAPTQSLAQTDEPAAEVEKVKHHGSIATQQTLVAERALKQLVDFNYDERPFDEIEEELETITGVNFILSRSAIDDSLTPDEPITFNLHQVPLGKALTLMLESKNATYVIDEGVVVIISLDDAEDAKWFRVKMFDCRELVKKLPETRPTTNTTGGHFGSGNLGGGGMFSMPVQATQKDSTSTPSAAESLDQKLEKILTIMRAQAAAERPKPSRDYTLLNLVQSIIQPDTWTETGQGLGQIKVVNGILVVAQTELVLREVENLIADLESQLLASQTPGAKASPVVSPFGNLRSSEHARLGAAGSPPASDPFDPNNHGSTRDPFDPSNHGTAQDPFDPSNHGTAQDPFNEN